MITNKYGLDPYDMPVIGIDFDGTIVYDAYPEIGEPIPGAIETINKWFNDGFWIVIHSCRAGVYEEDMRDWLHNQGIMCHTVNGNLQWRIDKYGSDTRKMSLDINIDDKNINYLGQKLTRYHWMDFKREVDYNMVVKYGKNNR
jgi:hypothetical protein